MQLGRQDVADKFHLPTSEVKLYTPKRTGKELGVLLAKEGGVLVIYLAYSTFDPQILDVFFVSEMLTACRGNCKQYFIEFEMMMPQFRCSATSWLIVDGSVVDK